MVGQKRTEKDDLRRLTGKHTIVRRRCRGKRRRKKEDNEGVKECKEDTKYLA